MPAPAERLKQIAPGNHHDLRTFYYTLRERGWLVALCLVVAASATTAYLMRAPKIYESKVVLQVEQEEQKVLNIEKVQQEHLQTLDFLKTVEQTLQNRTLLERVVATNKLAAEPRFLPLKPGESLTQEERITKMAKMVRVKLRRGTRLIDVLVEHQVPELAQLIAGSLVTEFLRQNFEHTAETAQFANEFLQAEAERLKKKLEESENALQAYKEQSQAASLEDRQNVVVQRLKELGAKVTEAKSQRITQEAAYNQVQKLAHDTDALLSVPAVAADLTIVEIRSNLSKLESEIGNLQQRYLPKHPKLIQSQSQLAELKAGLQKALLNVPQSIRSAYESAKTAEQALEQALREQETAALDLNKQAIRYNVLARDVESDRALYQSVVSRIKETSVTKDLKSDKVRIIQRANLPEKPVKPKPIKVGLFGFLGGLAAGLILVFFLDSIDRSLKTVDQAEEYLGLPVLGVIPKFSGVPANQRKLITADDAQSCEAESFRTLRTALSMLGRKEDRRTYLFTSALPAEGKTFCSINFALSLAQQGLRTLIVDCDLRRPMVEKTLLSNNKRGFGLTDFLTAQKELSQVVHSTETEHFFYLPAGSHAPNPAELLAKTGIEGLIDEALQHYDRVVVDSAPIHAVSDTLLVLNRIQTVCLVMRARKTPKNAILRAVQVLQEANAPLAGVIMNLMPRSRGGSYYYNSYYHYSYYGYYGDKGKKKGKSEKDKKPVGT